MKLKKARHRDCEAGHSDMFPNEIRLISRQRVFILKTKTDLAELPHRFDFLMTCLHSIKMEMRPGLRALFPDLTLS